MNKLSVTANHTHTIGDADNLAIQVVPVTPELAKQWLGNNRHNRPMRDRTVTDYARDMAAGHWHLNGEAIKRAADGTLLDGQHRLKAVIASATTIPMIVVTGLDPDTQETMDAGRRRRVSDVLSLRGEANPTILAAIARRVWAWERGDRRLMGNATPTTAEVADTLTAHPELRRSVEVGTRVNYQFRYLPQTVVGFSHYLFNKVASDQAPEFFARLGDGADLPLGHPVLTLRTRIISERTDGHRVPEERVLGYLIRVWNAVRDGRDLTRIQHPTGSDMPTPK